MAHPTHSELQGAERLLRQDDRALRLRFSYERDRILVERKTFRGRVGAVMPKGLDYRPDEGRQREEGHVEVCSIAPGLFHTSDLRDSLRAADSWRKWDRAAKPRWQRLEEQESAQKAERDLRREMEARYRASQLFDRYVTLHKQRVYVPTQIG